MRKKRENPMVYSTETGKHCPSCGKPVNGCVCHSNTPVFPGDSVVRIQRQTKGRKGSGVSLISGLAGTESEIKKKAKELKKICGSGGTVKQGIIEIQGDHRQLLFETLKKQGYTVKLAGG